MNLQQDPTAVWARHARQWGQIGAPLRPSAEDTRFMEELASPALAAVEDKPPDIAVLGVTPELIQHRWPKHARLYAFDQSEEMIASVWQPHPHCNSSAHCARWQDLPLPSGSITAAIGDGSLNTLADTEECLAVFTEVNRVLAPNGRLVLRCFIKPKHIETPAQVASSALAGKIESFHAFKWRFSMALASGKNHSVAVADIHAAFEHHFPNRTALSKQTCWPLETIRTIDAYRDVSTRYIFPTMEVLEAIAAPLFAITAVRYGHYELAERCPTLCFTPKGSQK